jgi:hypothetical protein
MEAVFWRQALKELDRDRIHEAFQQAELGWLRGAILDDLKVRNEKALNKPLILQFRARAPEVAITQGGNLVMRSAPLPLNTGGRYASLPHRVTGMVVPYAPLQEADIQIRLKGARFTDIPQDAEVKSGFGTFSRHVEGGGNKVELKFRSELKTGVVEPTAYDKLADFARRVETETQALLRARPG